MQLRNLIFVFLFCLSLSACGKFSYTVYSPDKQIKAIVHPNPLRYQLIYDGDTITDLAHPSLSFQDGTVWNGDDRYVRTMRRYRGVVNPVVGKNSSIMDHFNELTLSYGTYQVVFRAYNEGFAYRFVATGRLVDSLTIISEQAEFPLRNDPKVIYGESPKITTWAVPNHVYDHVSSIDSGVHSITPTVFLYDTALIVVVAESDVHNYPGMFLIKQPAGLVGYWATSPKTWELGSYLSCCTVVTERHDYLARVPGNHTFPWRIIIPTKDDKTLLNNELVYLLAEPCKIDDTSWIKPGKTAWEWWHCAMVPDAPFPSGPKNLSTQLYKYYIDFAAENGLEYMLIDDGWNDKFHPFDVNPNIDIHEVIRYGKEKGVDIWLWAVFSTMSQDPCTYMDTLASWGATGLKIDFFERDDDQAMFWYEEFARLAAERHLMLDYHGCSKPYGLNRTYPNVLTFEAVRGHECSKWDTTSNPDYRLQLLYNRCLAGPIDYTPGAMRNCYMSQFKPIDPGWPSGIGTRCQDLAMYVLFDQYLAMLIDSPDAYRQDSTTLRYLSHVPVVWDETLPLDGRVGEKAVVAKRSGDTWYVAGMCSWQPTTITVSFDFLEPSTTYHMQSFTDVPSDTIDASHYSYIETQVTCDSQSVVHMAGGGGFVYVLTPVQ